ncbi:helix-turn-helix domain-containing protein [Blastopirellula marina]|uniref:DNA-binding protein n=1 Tax=Blastopirellula marina TaxID=124 RepID=A0A2S8GQM2_9BACT|nr:helix-turn-helix domain-containing protein [Blastopirellula marina]PQO46717.1 DNA-binding protein [Blastopirellula marina]
MAHPALAPSEAKADPPSVKQPETLLVNKKTAADMLQVSEKTLDNFITDFGLPCIRLGRNIRFSVEALRNWISERGTQ